MSYLPRKQATQACAAHLQEMLGFNDIVDVRKQKVNFQIFSCRIIGDSCVILIANTVTEAKDYINKSMGAVSWTQADTNDWPAPYTKLSCYAGINYGQTTNKLVLYRVPDNMPYGPHQTFKEFIKANK